MKRIVLAALVLAPLQSSCNSTPAPAGSAPSAAARRPDPDAARLLADVAWLADDAREGRRAASPGERASSEYIAARFGELGLEPAGEEGYFQRFEVDLPPRDGGESFVSLLAPGESERTVWRAGVAAVSCSKPEPAQANGLVFGGYGIQDPEREWLDYGPVREGGAKPLYTKAVLVLRGAPATDPPRVPEGSSGWGPNPGVFHKVMTARRLGAGTVILAQHPEDAGAPLLPFDAAQAGRAGVAVVTVTAEVAEELLPGFAVAVAAIDAGEAPHPFTSRGPRTEGALRVHGDVRRERGEATNVLGRLPGGDGPTVVVGAHYDHLGRGGPGSLDPQGAGRIHNGADDNASGTAVVMELARILAGGPRPRGDVLFALWSGEEMGLLGSAHFVEHPTLPLSDVAANLNLDMVGRAGGGTCEVLGAGTSPPFAGWMEAAEAASGLELVVSLSGQGLGGSDHQSFLAREIPALHLFTGLHEDYHRPTDDTERFEAAGAARVTTLALELLDDMQAAPELAFVAPDVDAEAPARNRGGMRVRFGSVPVYSYEGEGMLISGTSPGSPAERAGLVGGDVILRLGDIEIDSVRAFAYALKVHKPGDVVQAVYRRDGREESVLVTLESRAQE